MIQLTNKVQVSEDKILTSKLTWSFKVCIEGSWIDLRITKTSKNLKNNLLEIIK